MKLEATYLCEKAILDSQTKKMSLINIIPNSIIPAGLPMYMPSITIVIVLCKDKIDNRDNYDAVLKISNNDHVLIDVPINIDFTGSMHNNNIIELQNGLMVNEIGKLKFEVQIIGIDIQIKHEINIETQVARN
jgi:hypothetical protein